MPIHIAWRHVGARALPIGAACLLALVTRRAEAQTPHRVWAVGGVGAGVAPVSCRDCVRVSDQPVGLAGFAAAGWAVTPQWRLGARVDGWTDGGRRDPYGVEWRGTRRALMGVVEYAPHGRLGLGAQAGLGRIRTASASEAVRVESTGLGAGGALSYGVAAGPQLVLAPYGAYLVQLRHRVTINGRAYPELYLRTRVVHGGLSLGWR